jgi:Icc-related predicted phosphoesterase
MVLTHHAPSPRSLDPRFHGQVTNAAFAPDLSKLIRAANPTFWVHGHVHRAQDYVEGQTRVLCNPLGYRGEHGATGFRSGLVIETTPITEDE